MIGGGNSGVEAAIDLAGLLTCTLLIRHKLVRPSVAKQTA
ncbi:hypothetical protein ACINWC141_1680 [Acinetobacter sp. WC-141]|nr:hypothetical protein ACINWC141_1680 [Acinetobacter sp. WC-141]